MKKFIWIVVLIFTVSACDLQEVPITPPARPEAVPEQAFWVGGPEGGVFIQISKNQNIEAYFGTVYFETNGETWYQGPFQYTGSSPFDVTSKSSYTGWDGDYLFLSNGEKLIAIGQND